MNKKGICRPWYGNMSMDSLLKVRRTFVGGAADQRDYDGLAYACSCGSQVYVFRICKGQGLKRRLLQMLSSPFKFP
jgi:hypothetical protein